MIQVPCPSSGNIIVTVLQYRAGSGGWIKLAFKKVAGDGGLTYAALAPAGTDPVSRLPVDCTLPVWRGFMQSEVGLVVCGWTDVRRQTEEDISQAASLDQSQQFRIFTMQLAFHQWALAPIAAAPAG
jgi:hypothetical protein